MALIVALSLLPACAEEITPTPAPRGPVKIGYIAPWSGPEAMSGTYYADPVTELVTKQVRDMGGILGGREVNFIKCDTRSTVADSVACARKLSSKDKVSGLVGGSHGPSSMLAISEFAEENKILYCPWMSDPGDIAQKKYTLWFGYPPGELERMLPHFAISVLKPKTAAYLAWDETMAHKYVAAWVERCEAVGTKTVYKDFYATGTKDFTPYLTKIRYVNPDVLFGHVELVPDAPAVAKQIMELGGWGDIKSVWLSPAVRAVGSPGAEGWYIQVPWITGLPYAGAKKLEQEFQAVARRAPDQNVIYSYNPPWTIIHAIELAGTEDREAIARAAFSGNLKWDSAFGPVQINTKGESTLQFLMVQIQSGKAVMVEWSG